MDADANLAEQRDLATMLWQEAEREENFVPSSDWCMNALRLAELVQALDKWMSTGGLIPRAWR